MSAVEANPVTGYWTATAKTNYVELGFKPSRVECRVNQTNPDMCTWATGMANPGGHLTAGSSGTVTVLSNTTGIQAYDALPTRAADDTHFRATTAANSAGDERVYNGHAVVTDALVATAGDEFYGLSDDMGAGFAVGTAITAAATVYFTAWR